MDTHGDTDMEKNTKDIIKGTSCRGDGGFLSSFPMRPVTWLILPTCSFFNTWHDVTAWGWSISDAWHGKNRWNLLEGETCHVELQLLRTSLPRGVPDGLLTPNLRRQFVRKVHRCCWLLLPFVGLAQPVCQSKAPNKKHITNPMEIQWIQVILVGEPLKRYDAKRQSRAEFFFGGQGELT